MNILATENLSLCFGEKRVVEELSLTIEKGKILSILGPNGSGKSTLLKALSRKLKPTSGVVYFTGKDIQTFNSKNLACQLAVLMQSPQAPGDLTVRNLVEYGRYPHQHWWKGQSKEDNNLVDWALEQTGISNMENRLVNTLSGGEQQRTWIAMALAQKPGVLLLDEPTTYLDICHQLEIMDLIVRLNKENGITVVMVLHDINHAARYSDLIAVLRQGKLFAVGQPVEVITTTMLRDVFNVEADICVGRDDRPICIIQGLSAVNKPTLAIEK